MKGKNICIKDIMNEVVAMIVYCYNVPDFHYGNTLCHIYD